MSTSWSEWRSKAEAAASSAGDVDAKNLIDKAWAAGTLGYRRPLNAAQEEDDSHVFVKLACFIKRIIESRDRELLLNQFFTTPRNTGVLLLGFCSLLQWRYESYIIKLLQIIQHVKFGDIHLGIVPAAPPSIAVPSSKRKRGALPGQVVVRVQPEVVVAEDGSSMGDSMSAFGRDSVNAPAAFIHRALSSNPAVDLMADFSTFLQDLEGSQELLSLQDQLLKNNALAATSQAFRLDDLDVEEEDGQLGDSAPLMMEDDDAADESSFFSFMSSAGGGTKSQQAANLTDASLRATADLSQAFLRPSQDGPEKEANEDDDLDAALDVNVSPPVPSLNLRNAAPLSPSPSVLRETPPPASSDEAELVTMRHTEAPSARVRRRDSIGEDASSSVLREAGKVETKRVAKHKDTLATAGGLFNSKRVKSLFVLEDQGSLTREDAGLASDAASNETAAERLPFINRRLGPSYDWRAITEIPDLWKVHIRKLACPLEDRFRVMISNALLNKYLDHRAANKDTTNSLYSSDYFNSGWENQNLDHSSPPVDDHTAQRSVASSDRRSARFGLSSSLTASSSGRVDMQTPCLSLDDENSASKTLDFPPHGSSREEEIPAMAVADLYCESTVETPLGDLESQHVEMTADETGASQKTVSQAEARYNPHTWQMLCVVRNNIKKRAELLGQEPDKTFICFHDLVPPRKCRRNHAAQAIYQVLLLFTLNELTCHQESAFGSIKIMMGKGPLRAATSSALVTSSTGTWSSNEEPVCLAQHPATGRVYSCSPVPPALPPAERKRSRRSKVSPPPPSSSGESSPGDSPPCNENEAPKNLQGSKRRRLHNS